MRDRLYPRVEHDATASVRTGTHEIKCRVRGVSASGMALETGMDEDLGRFVRVTTHLEAGAPRLDLDAIVQRREIVDGKRLWSVEYFEPSPSTVALIADYVREKLAASAPAETLAAGAASSPAPKTDPEVERLFDEALRNLG